MDNYEIAKEFSKVHKEARIQAGISQEFMALSLCVSKKTISNWEKGISSPSFLQSLKWFSLLNINPFPYYLKLTFPNYMKEVPYNKEEINKAFDNLIGTFSDDIKLALLYVFLGDHGSSPTALIQLLLAHLHTPIKTRLIQATLIAHDYELEKSLNELICEDSILPDMEVLNTAIYNARISTINHEDRYAMKKDI